MDPGLEESEKIGSTSSRKIFQFVNRYMSGPIDDNGGVAPNDPPDLFASDSTSR